MIDPRENLKAYLDRELPPEEMEEITRALETDASLRAELEELRALTSAVREMAREVKLSPRKRDALRKRLYRSLGLPAEPVGTGLEAAARLRAFRLERPALSYEHSAFGAPLHSRAFSGQPSETISDEQPVLALEAPAEAVFEALRASGRRLRRRTKKAFVVEWWAVPAERVAAVRAAVGESAAIRPLGELLRQWEGRAARSARAELGEALAEAPGEALGEQLVALRTLRS